MSIKYDPHFKQEVINLALNSDQSYRQTVNDLGINYSTLRNWVYTMINKPTQQTHLNYLSPIQFEEKMI